MDESSSRFRILKTFDEEKAFVINSIPKFRLKCYYDQILDIHFFTFSYTTGLPKISCQISIYYEQYNSCFLDLYFREFMAAINFPCSKSGLRIGEKCLQTFVWPSDNF